MIDRRHWLTATASGFAAYAIRTGNAHGVTKVLQQSTCRCIILWMDGGPSQLETFDPKPGTNTGGPTQALETEIDGLQVSEHLPMLARRASDLNVIRSLTSREGEHLRAKYLQHTGFQPIAAFPRPELGALLARQLHQGELPGFVTLGSPGLGPAYLGEEFAPFAIEDPVATVRLLKQLRDGRHRFQLLDSLNHDFDQQWGFGRVHRRKATLRRVEGLLDTRLTELLDVEREPAATWQAYGDTAFARNLVLARRLIESGVTCVEVQLGGWDTHQNNFSSTARLCHQLDRPWAALIDDLKQRELWDDTLVIWMGDFGRTPTINPQLGRDHFPTVSNAVLAGGGLRGGTIIGRTNALGMSIEENPVSIADLFATLLSRIGIRPDQEFETSFGSPTSATDGGKVIPELA